MWFVAAACWAIPVSWGGGKGWWWEDVEATTQTTRDYNTEALYCNQVEGFYGFKEIKLSQEHFWLILLKLVVTAGMLWLARSVCHSLLSFWFTDSLFWPILLIRCEFACTCLCLLYYPASVSNSSNFALLLNIFLLLLSCLHFSVWILANELFVKLIWVANFNCTKELSQSTLVLWDCKIRWKSATK